MKSNYWAPIFLLAIAGFIFGCSDDDKTTDPGGWQPPTQYEVGPAGDTIEVDNQLQFIIPPGALDSTVRFAFLHTDPPNSPPAPLGLVTYFYVIGPSAATFNVPAILTLHYNESDVGGGNEDNIKMYTYDGTWLALTTALNTATNTVSITISDLSKYYFCGLVDTTSMGGVYAKLVVGRNVTYIGGGDPYRIDAFEAAFDSAYAPCLPVQPISTVTATCNDHTLIWNESADIYTYPELPLPTNPLIALGETYTFQVTAGGGVSALTKSIVFPVNETYITYPTMMTTLDRSGFTITWAGAGSGTVELTLMDYNGQIAIFEETPNDGSYAVSSNLLNGLAAGECSILISHHNIETFTASGYDSRSYIAARVQSQTVFTLQ